MTNQDSFVGDGATVAFETAVQYEPTSVVLSGAEGDVTEDGDTEDGGAFTLSVAPAEGVRFYVGYTVKGS